IPPFHYTDCFSVRQIGYGGKVLSPEQTGEKQPEPKHSLKERLQYEQEQKKQKQVQKAPKQKKQDMEL
ncbi:hypothetical protein DXC43_17015, partial [Subdoligranulum sp. TF05-17AC]